MPPICAESIRWITENISVPVMQFVRNTWNACVAAPTPINFLCMLIVIIIAIVMWIVVMIMYFVAVVICFVAVVLELVSFLVNLVLSIPVIGRLIKLLLTLALEIIWRAVFFFDYLLTVAGAQIPKKIGIRVIILRDENGTPLTTEAALQPVIDNAATIFQNQMNVRLINNGFSIPQVNAPSSVLNIECGMTWVDDFGINGSFIEYVSATSSYVGGFNRLIGYGAEIIVLVVRNVGPDGMTSITTGCSPGPHDYVFIEATSGLGTLAHEIGHACGLFHVSDPSNLMNDSGAGTTLNENQRGIFRWSRHCTFF